MALEIDAVNKLTKERHELIRRKEAKLISDDDFNRAEKKILDEIRRIRQVDDIQAKESKDIKNKKISKDYISLNVKTKVLQVILSNNGFKTREQFTNKVHLEVKGFSKISSKIYAYKVLKALRENRIEVEGYEYDDENIRFVKK
jgi:hypothetical protein